MYELFFSVGTACFAPLMVLEESDLDHRVTMVDIAAGAHHKPEYLEINPAGKVPALRMSDGKILTEASAICLYLADKHDLRDIAPGIEETDRALFLRWLMYLATSVQDHAKRLYYPERYSTAAEDAPGIKARAIELLFESLIPVNEHLSVNGPFFLGKRSSVADTYLLMIVTWYPDADELRSTFPAIRKSFDLVARRPLIKARLEQQTHIGVER